MDSCVYMIGQLTCFDEILLYHGIDNCVYMIGQLTWFDEHNCYKWPGQSCVHDLCCSVTNKQMEVNTGMSHSSHTHVVMHELKECRHNKHAKFIVTQSKQAGFQHHMQFAFTLQQSMQGMIQALRTMVTLLTFSSTKAATGKQLKQSVNVFQRRMLYRRLHSS